MEKQTVHIVPMTKAEFLGKEKPLTISYSIVRIASNAFLIASTSKGICFLMPAEKRWHPVETLKQQFPKSRFRCRQVALHKRASQLLKRKSGTKVKELPLHLYGTTFQLSVWQELLSIECGLTTTYGEVAARIGNPRSARPVGQAVGANPVMCLIPCHRVICSNGKLGGYHWGVERKIKLLNAEAKAVPQREGYERWEPMMF